LFQRNKKNEIIKKSNEIIYINFFNQKNLDENKYLIIDSLKFTFSHNLDSIYKFETTLPSDYLTIKRPDGETRREKNSPIFISSTLYEKLKKTKKYKIKSLPEMLTRGTLKLYRVDGKKITIETNCEKIIQNTEKTVQP